MTTILSAAEKELAEELGLTPSEMKIAKSTRIPPEVFARHKKEIQAERDESEAMWMRMNDALLERAKYAPPGRGKRPMPRDDE